LKYKGQIEFHAEMCCGSWPQFHDDRGLHGDKNQYWNWDWTINFNKKTKLDNLTVYGNDESILYCGTWTFNSKNTLKNGGLVSPFEIDPEKWMEYVFKGCKCSIETDELVKALREDKDG
jgi:hypothetical protein